MNILRNGAVAVLGFGYTFPSYSIVRFNVQFVFYYTHEFLNYLSQLIFYIRNTSFLYSLNISSFTLYSSYYERLSRHTRDQYLMNRLYFLEELCIFYYFPVKSSGTTLPYTIIKKKNNKYEHQRNVVSTRAIAGLHTYFLSRPAIKFTFLLKNNTHQRCTNDTRFYPRNNIFSLHYANDVAR